MHTFVALLNFPEKTERMFIEYMQKCLDTFANVLCVIGILLHLLHYIQETVRY